MAEFLPSDIDALLLTLRLATSTTLVLLVISPPLAWWLARSQNSLRSVVEAVVALPLILPPTVLGFYLLLMFSPSNGFGKLWLQLTGSPLVFSFSGLLLASILCSLPFVVQPLQAAFKQFDTRLLDQAQLLQLNRVQQFFIVVLPLTLPTFVTAALLAFAHTIGEFGVVLMIGGNLEGETRVLSIALFEHVEALDYAAAHRLALVLIGFSMVALLLIYGWSSKHHRELLCQ